MRNKGEGYRASCPVPAHGQGRGDRDPSLSVGADHEGNVLLKCFANCDNQAVVGAIGLGMRDLFEHRNGSDGIRAGEGGANTPSKARSTDQPSEPATLEDYAAYVALPVGFLKGLGLREIRYLGEPAVRMPYLDATGEEALLTRFRVSLTDKPKVKTKSGDKHRLYGLWKLEEAREDFGGWTAGAVRVGIEAVARATDESPDELLEVATSEAKRAIIGKEQAAERVARDLAVMSRERLLPDEKTLEKVARYEAHLSRLLYKAMHELEALQARRQGSPVPLARLDVDGLPEGIGGE